MTMLLLKTRQEHMDQVRKSRKHASDGCPQNAAPGDWLLVQVTSGPPGNETHRIKYAMRLARCYEDRTGETQRLFGHSWRYVIEGEDFRILRRPFDIERIRVSDANYGQGVIRFVYIHPADEKVILDSNRLEGA